MRSLVDHQTVSVEDRNYEEAMMNGIDIHINTEDNYG